LRLSDRTYLETSRGDGAGQAERRAATDTLVQGDHDAVPWDRVEEWLIQARNYWVSTTRADGQNHATPVWGIWRDGAFYFDTNRLSGKARNLSEDPAIAVHLDGGDEAVRLEGTAHIVTDPTLITQYLDDYAAKYQVRPDPDDR